MVGWAAQMGTITFHPWPVRADDVDHPDELRLDLDPQPGTDFADAARVATRRASLLDELGYAGFPKTSGGRGIHIYVRIEPRWTFTDVRHAAIAFGRELERRLPDQVTTSWWKEERGQRIFIDYNQNARDRTIASAYSIRPKPGAPVSAPLAWEELPEVAPEEFTVATMPARFARSATAMRAIDDVAHSLEPLLDLYERDRAAGLGDMPYPPDYPKMPGEPKRVQPSRDRDRPRELPLRQRAWGSLTAPRRAAGADGGGTTGPMSPSGASSRSTITGAWSLGPLPLRAWRSTHAACTRSATADAGQDEVDAHAEVLVEHPGAVVPVGEDPLGRPAVAHDVVQAERLQLGQRRALGRGDVGLARRRPRDRTRPRRWARCSCRRTRRCRRGSAPTMSRSAASQASL